TQSPRRIKRGVERRYSLGVETAAAEFGTATGQRRARIDRIQRTVELPNKAPLPQRHQAKTPASSASIYSRTCCARPSCTSCIAVRPSKPGRGSERYHAYAINSEPNRGATLLSTST